MQYDEHYELMARLEQEAGIIPAPALYNADLEKLYAAMMNRLAAPLPDGSESPFSSQSPLSAHGQLMGNMAYLHGLLAHEVNLMPDLTWVNLFRMLGIGLESAEYPVIQLEFRRSREGIIAKRSAIIPAGTEVRSTIDPTLSAITLSILELSGETQSATVTARLNRIGKLTSNLQPGEFSDLPRYLSYVESVRNTGVVIFPGREDEKLPSAMLRARQEFQAGGRCVRAEDFQQVALNAGAQKVTVLPRVQVGNPGKFGNLISVIVYPSTAVALVDPIIRSRSLAGITLDIVPAEIIPVGGKIQVRVISSIETNREAFNLAATAIQKKINPPNGTWGDRFFESSLASALELVDGIVAVPKMELRHAITNQPLNEIEVKPWNLFQIQDERYFQFEWLR